MKRYIVIAFLATCSVLGGLAVAAPPIPVAQRKFDHDRHVNAARQAGKSADCKDCHRMDASGNALPGKEHTRCASCHTYPSSCATLRTPGPKGPARVCEVCHVAKRKECLPGDLPAPPTADSFTEKFAHGKHLAFGVGIEAGCVQCHAGQAPGPVPKGQAHKLCSTCHNAQGVAAQKPISNCTTCHAQSSQPKPTTPPDAYRLAGFDHKAHHAASQKTAGCTSCHDKLVGSSDVPRSSMLGCQTKCHDGGKAFSAVGTKCTQCHKGSEPAIATRADMPFVHAAHAARNVKIADCAMCHGIEADGKLTPPLAKKDHMPCAASGCHQAEFASRATKICGVCHDAVAPWQKASSRAKPPLQPEWYESIDHAAHLAKLGNGNAACASCHGGAGEQLCVSCHAVGGVGGNPHPPGWSSNQPLSARPCRLCHLGAAR